MTSPLAIWARPAESFPSLVESAAAERSENWRLWKEVKDAEEQRVKASKNATRARRAHGSMDRVASGCACAVCNAMRGER